MLSSHATTTAIFEPRERLILTCAGIIAFILGVLGYKEYFITAKQTASFFDFCYHAINLFLMQFEAKGELPWKLEVARWLSPATLSYTIFKAVMALVKDSVQAYQLKKKRGHSIIFGLDKGTFELACSMQEQGVSPAVVDSDNNNEYFGLLATRNIPFLVANPADPTILKKLNVSEAKYLIAATELDSTNLEIIYQNYGQKRTTPLNTVCKVSNPSLIRTLCNRPLFKINHSNILTKIINSQKVTARWLVNYFGPDSLRTDLASLNVIKICVVGNNQMLSALPLRLTEIGIYGVDSALEITVINYGEAAVGEDEFHRLVNNDVIAQFAKVTYKEMTGQSIEALQSLMNFSDIHCCYVCMKEADLALMVLQSLIDLSVSCPVVVTDTDNTGSFDWLVSDFSEMENVHFAQTHKVTHSFASIFGEEHDQIAKRIHERYVAEQIARGEVCDANSSIVDWNDLPEILKDANRNQADHIATKCRLVTGQARPETSLLSDLLTGENIEVLAKIEHRRWVAEKLINGWRYTTGEKDVARRLSPSLIGWEELSESEKQKDRDTILNLPHLLKQLQITTSFERQY